MMELREEQRGQGVAARRRMWVLRASTNRFAAFRDVGMPLRGRIALVIPCLLGATSCRADCLCGHFARWARQVYCTQLGENPGASIDVLGGVQEMTGRQ